MGELTRRGFLLSCLALGAAPAIVRADSLMRVVPRGLIVETMRTETALWTDSYWRFTDLGLEVRSRRFITDLADGGWTQGPWVLPIAPFTRGAVNFMIPTLGNVIA